MIFEKQILKAYKSIAFTRCDDQGTAYYFSAADFPGLVAEPYPFLSDRGVKLQGYLYHYEKPIPGRIVVFDHGFFGGHRSYMREIEMLCRRGYLVFAYDHTGCMESGGTDPNGMAQSLCDLDDCIKMIKADHRFAGLDISVVGHSWGGFSTMNIAALHPEISHLVVMSGFVSVELLVGSIFKGILKLYKKAVMKLETESNPFYVHFNGVNSLAETAGRVLLIYSADDPMCKKEPHYDALYAGLSDKPNVEFLLVEGKGHNPNYTADAVAYLGEYVAEKNRLAKAKALNTPEEKAAFVKKFDWRRMTEQDEAVWEEIFRALDAR
ncbi:MAG: alpha/beta fold hydrolase [Clostridia bacterium]|nr:alpha/beta fold hydrolase [Clostridia bacterium]